MYILFDIGGTKTRVSATKNRTDFVGEPVVYDTPDDFSEGIAKLKDVAEGISKGVKIKAVGGGIAGPLDYEKKVLLNSPNLPRWVGKPLSEEISTAFNTPVFIENDSAVVGLGEAHYGAGKGFAIVAYITISTGVGGVRIIDGKIVRSALGFEPGHQIIDADHSLCPKCISGNFDDMVSGTATEKRFGMKAYEVKEREVWDEELPLWVSYGLVNTILHWSPDVVVLGGSMMVGNPAINIEQIRRYVKEQLSIFPKIPQIKKAELSDLGGLYGAMVLISQHL